MDGGAGLRKHYIYQNGKLEQKGRQVVVEFPLVLHVNGREIATLVASRHDLRFLVAGFLRLQGFVERAADFDMLAVCEDYGVANVRIRRELPERLKPILTSGCGTGITFSMPGAAESPVPFDSETGIAPEALFRLMADLHRSTESYRTHGGIHSAAVAEPDGTILLFAEDIGRHNTIDRIAGEAMLKEIDLRGKFLVTSGRVSSEMAAKAAMLGVCLIASRTSPTDKAIDLCESAGITLVGYVRGGKFGVYSHPWRISLPDAVPAQPAAASAPRLPGVSGIILAGGASSRMGSNKALLPYRNGRFIDAIYRQLSELFDEIIVVTNTPEQYAFLPCRKVPDIFSGVGALGGIHAGLSAIRHETAFIAACDMPFLSNDLIAHLVSLASGWEAVIPCTPAGFEPLHGIYSRSCLESLDKSLAAGTKKVMDILDKLHIRLMAPGEIARFDPEYRSFSNINTPQEYYRLREQEAASLSETDGAVKVS